MINTKPGLRPIAGRKEAAYSGKDLWNRWFQAQSEKSWRRDGLWYWWGRMWQRELQRM